MSVCYTADWKVKLPRRQFPFLFSYHKIHRSWWARPCLYPANVVMLQMWRLSLILRFIYLFSSLLFPTFANKPFRDRFIILRGEILWLVKQLINMRTKQCTYWEYLIASRRAQPVCPIKLLRIPYKKSLKETIN